MRLAGIDIGTLTCRLLIAEVTESGELRELRSDRRVLRLGEGLARTGRLGEAAMARVLATLEEWRGVMDRADLRGQRLVATSAVRQAANRDEFLRRVQAEASLDLEVISGQEEARLTMCGIRAGLASEATRVLAIDVGGGSTELVMNGRSRVPADVSMDVGAVTLTEQWLTADPPTSEQVAQARAVIRAAVEQGKRRVGELEDGVLVGTAGTITTMAAMVQRLPAYDPARIHNYALSLQSLRDLEETLLQRTSAERRGLPGLEPGREDVIVAGTLIVHEIMESFGARTCLVSDFGLREGIVLDLAAKMGAGREARGKG